MAFVRKLSLGGSGAQTSGSASTYIGDINDIWADDVDFNTLRRGDGTTSGGVIIGTGAYNITEDTINKNLGVGEDALELVSGPATLNTAVGYHALRILIDNSSKNTAIGALSLRMNKFGSENTAIGYATMSQHPGTGGSYNTAVGSEAMLKNNTAGYNTAVGYHALKDNINGESNVAIGANALQLNGGNGNVGVGPGAMYHGGQENVAIGGDAGGLGGSNNVFIGTRAGLASPAASNQLVISNRQSYNEPDNKDLIRGNFSTGTVTFNEAYTFPIADGTASQVLTTDGAGNLSWANETITLSTLKSITAASSDFADFQTRIAAL